MNGGGGISLFTQELLDGGPDSLDRSSGTSSGLLRNRMESYERILLRFLSESVYRGASLSGGTLRNALIQLNLWLRSLWSLDVCLSGGIRAWQQNFTGDRVVWLD